MRWTNPNSLGKTVEAKAANRPVKFAYIVPIDHPHVDEILNAVFYESYTRWAGVYTLVIPVSEGALENDGYAEWLTDYDPDFVYSYANLPDSFIKEIDEICCPIGFLEHDYSNTSDGEIDFRCCLPRWDHYIQPVSSITTICSPANLPRFPTDGAQLEPTLLTQFDFEPADRFLADNFGLAYSVNGSSNPILGLFKTMCLVPEDLPANMVAGTERCHSVLDAFAAVTDRRVLTVSRLAILSSDNVSRSEDPGHGRAFRLFVGDTPLDRIHFWNARHFRSGWSYAPAAMVVGSSSLDDEPFVDQLGEFFNKHNVLGFNSGQKQIEVYSSSIERSALESIVETLRPKTWNAVSIARTFDDAPMPVRRKTNPFYRRTISGDATLRLTEDSTDVVASDPVHFHHLPPQRRGLGRGQWVVELDIERHNNLSRYSNVVDTWVLPQRWGVTSAFTRRLAKPTQNGSLALIPSYEGFPFGQREGNKSLTYELYLPSDEMFFRYLVLDPYPYPDDDLRSKTESTSYVDMAVSDKGQNLRGVISLFDNLITAYEIMTHQYWRDVLDAANENATRARALTRDKLNSILSKDKSRTEQLMKELRLKSTKETASYLQDSLTDTLEYLVRSNVFFQVAQWRCQYCGFQNSRSFDQMKIRNACTICETEYLAKIDLEWTYELSEFVFRSLKTHSGLPVLWALGFLQDDVRSGSFWYLPEIDLYEKADDPECKNEIDVLCVLNGKFIAAEAKNSVASFLANSTNSEKFTKVMKQLGPDTAMLVFQSYCHDDSDVPATKTALDAACKKIRTELGNRIELRVLIAEETRSYGYFSPELGTFGRRTGKYTRQ